MIPFQHGVFATAAGAASGFEAIATVTATGGETSLTFSSIPQTYASLQIRGIALGTNNATLNMRVNGNTNGTLYYMHGLFGTGSSVSAASSSGSGLGNILITMSNGSVTSTTNPLGFIQDIHEYSSTSKIRTIRTFYGINKNGTVDEEIGLQSALFNDNTAVTSLTYLIGGGTFSAGTKIALYGIKAAA